MTIRRYQPGEEAAIWTVYFRATHESNALHYHPDLLKRWAPPDQDMGEWVARVASKNPFVALIDQQIVGMAEVDEEGGIDYFYVLPEFQGRGIGSQLMLQIEREAKGLGLDELRADVSVTAKDFFVSSGFQIVQEHANVILGHPAPNFSMAKKI